MPKKRQSQPMQVWLANADLLRLQHAAKKQGRTQSDIARECILGFLENCEKAESESSAFDRVFERFSKPALKVVSLAKNEAEVTDAPLVGSEHLLLSLCVAEGLCGKLLSKHGLSPGLIRTKMGSIWRSTYAKVDFPPYSPTFIRIAERARLIAKRRADRYVQPEHLLLSLLEQGNGAAFNVLEFVGLSRSELEEDLRRQMPLLRKQWRWNRK